jgi:hypothetical protein
MKKLIAVLVVVVLGVSSVALAAGAKTKTVNIGGTIHSAIVGANTKGGQIAGAAKDRGFGQVAIIFANVSAGKGLHVPFTFYTKNGSFSGSTTVDIILGNGGAVTIENGKFTVTSGGGALAGVKGSGTFSGTGTVNTSQTITYKGKLTVKK